MSTEFNCQKHFYFKLFSLAKQFLIKFGMGIIFGYTQLNVKTLPFQTIRFNIGTRFKCHNNCILNNTIFIEINSPISTNSV